MYITFNRIARFDANNRVNSNTLFCVKSIENPIIEPFMRKKAVMCKIHQSHCKYRFIYIYAALHITRSCL